MAQKPTGHGVSMCRNNFQPWCVGTIVYSGAQMCAPEDNFCLYMQNVGEAVKVSFYETHHNVFNSVFCLFVKVVVR